MKNNKLAFLSFLAVAFVSVSANAGDYEDFEDFYISGKAGVILETQMDTTDTSSAGVGATTEESNSKGELLRRVLNGEALDKIIQDMAPRHAVTFVATEAFDAAIQKLGHSLPKYEYNPASTSNYNVSVGADY